MSGDRFVKTAGCLLLTAAISASALFSASALAQGSDPVVFTFATVGDSRQDPKAPDPTTLLPNNTGTLLPQDAIWLQNTKAWARILRTIQTEKASLLFLNGDMVMGYGRASVPTTWSTTPPTLANVVNSDLVKFYQQYAYWRGMVANMFETNTYVLPVAGNHESQCNSANSGTTATATSSGCASGKTAYPENEDAYRANMGDLINDLATNIRFSTVTGKTPSSVTGLTQASAPSSSTDPAITSNQADMSYSFDISTNAGLLHFVVINTDAVGADSHAPTGWLSTDLAAAKSRGVVKYFVMGHKPAWTYNYSAATGGTVAAAGLDVDLTARNSFWSLLSQYNATYFAGHEHIVHIDQHADPLGVNTAQPYQVLIGSGGSPFDDKLSGTCPNCVEPTMTNPTDRTYAWGLVSVHQSGAVSLTAYGFNDSFGPTTSLLSISNIQ